MGGPDGLRRRVGDVSWNGFRFVATYEDLTWVAKRRVEGDDDDVTVRVQKSGETRRDLTWHLGFSGNEREVLSTLPCQPHLLAVFQICFDIHIVLIVVKEVRKFMNQLRRYLT